jgi:hypothetical protein
MDGLGRSARLREGLAAGVNRLTVAGSIVC